jgi:DNA-directed RNA polymerase subunit RPC12/RpoP
MSEILDDEDLYDAECAECGSKTFVIMLTEDKEVYGTECTGCHLRTLYQDAVIYKGEKNPIVILN